jgi:hypothetical protein
MFEHKALNAGSARCIIWVVKGLKDLEQFVEK